MQEGGMECLSRRTVYLDGYQQPSFLCGFSCSSDTWMSYSFAPFWITDLLQSAPLPHASQLLLFHILPVLQWACFWRFTPFLRECCFLKASSLAASRSVKHLLCATASLWKLLLLLDCHLQFSTHFFGLRDSIFWLYSHSQAVFLPSRGSPLLLSAVPHHCPSDSNACPPSSDALRPLFNLYNHGIQPTVVVLLKGGNPSKSGLHLNIILILKVY